MNGSLGFATWVQGQGRDLKGERRRKEYEPRRSETS